MKIRTMTRTQAELLLAAVIIARSTSYVLTKVGLQDMGKFTLLAVRFLLAFAFLAVLFWRRLLHIDRRTLLSGLAMGGIYFCVMTAELTALKTVETSTVSFVTNTAAVIVPIVQAVLSRRWPERRALIGALACLLGVALLTLRNGLSFTPGVGYCILEAFLYSAAILVTDRLTHAGAEPLLSGVVQVGFLGLLALAASFLLRCRTCPAAAQSGWWYWNWRSCAAALASRSSRSHRAEQRRTTQHCFVRSILSLRQRWVRCAFTSTSVLRVCSAVY